MKYKVAAPFVELYSGVLALSKEQARDRIHNLKKVKSGYEIVKSVQFKRGEEFGYDAELTPQLAEVFGIPFEKEKNKKAAVVQTSAQTETLPGNPENIPLDAENGAVAE